ncbi:MAG: methyltransferase [Rhizobiaceae bacterium]|nr:methyltransferase [Rhizobiaceae bacterium]
MPGPEYTVDAFHKGRFSLVQPRGGAHRAGMDALVLAAAVPGGFSGRLADFGAGAGAAGFAVAARLAGATAVLVEREAAMAACAARSIAHPANAALAGRISLIVADVAAPAAVRRGAGLPDRSFDFVVMNPPFNDGRDRAAPGALRRIAHVAPDDLFETWLRAATAVLRPDGGLAVIARPEQVGILVSAAKGRFGGLEILPVHPTADKAAIRIVVRGRRGSRARLSIVAPLVLHRHAGGPPTGRAEAISAGSASLFGD